MLPSKYDCSTKKKCVTAIEWVLTRQQRTALENSDAFESGSLANCVDHSEVEPARDLIGTRLTLLPECHRAARGFHLVPHDQEGPEQHLKLVDGLPRRPHQ